MTIFCPSPNFPLNSSAASAQGGGSRLIFVPNLTHLHFWICSTFFFKKTTSSTPSKSLGDVDDHFRRRGKTFLRLKVRKSE
jgi:hypothetical protein